jgi:hypothetical protein
VAVRVGPALQRRDARPFRKYSVAYVAYATQA